MATNSELVIDIAVLQERSKHNQTEVNNVKEWVSGLDDEVEAVKANQNQTLVVLQKLESTLEHMSEKLTGHDAHDTALQGSVEALQLAHTRVAAKFKIVLAILAVIGTSIVGVAVKLLFFSPVLMNIPGG